MDPGHVETLLLLIAFIGVCFGRLNVAWWIYLTSVAFNVMENALCSICLVFLISALGDVALQSCNGNIHNNDCGPIPPFHTSLLL